MKTPELAVVALFFLAVCVRTLASADPATVPPAYDPLQIDPGSEVITLERVVIDADRERQIPLLIYLSRHLSRHLPRDLPPQMPPAQDAQPVVLFSHGLGGSRRNNPYLGRHWAARGYVVVFLQHPGSDEAVWRTAPPAQRLAELREAANLSNFSLRVRDVSAVLDQLARWSGATGDELAGRLDLRHVGMCGHSFGAITTQAVSGQRYLGGLRSFTDPRIGAALMLSPSAPPGGAGSAFNSVAVPWLLMTGTLDTAPIGNATIDSRFAVFPALPPGRKYELVLDKAEHSAFSDRPLPGDRQRRNPNHHRAILAVGTAFWDSHLRGDTSARQWLDGSGPTAVLQPTDRWQRK